MSAKWNERKSSRQVARQQCNSQGASSALLAAITRYTCTQGRQQLGDGDNRAGKQDVAHWQSTNNAKSMMAREGTAVCRHGMHKQDDLIGGRSP